MREPGVKHEGFRFAERIDHAMQEADEERGVEVHRTGGVEQHYKPQWLGLAPPEGEIDRHPAVRHAAVNGSPHVEPPSAAPHPLTPNQPASQ